MPASCRTLPAPPGESLGEGRARALRPPRTNPVGSEASAEVLTVFRGLLLVFVVFAHACTAFRPALGSPALPWITQLHSGTSWLAFVRMPAFFMVSGLLAFRSLDRVSPSAYLGRRLLRLGIPFLVALLLLNPADIALRVHFGSELGRWQSTPLLRGDLPGPFHGTSLLHLWYLATLCQLTLLSGGLFHAANVLRSHLSRAALAGVLGGLPLAGFLLQHLLGLLQPEGSWLAATRVLDLADLSMALPAFFSGMLLASRPDLLESLRKAWRTHLFLCLGGILLTFLLPFWAGSLGRHAGEGVGAGLSLPAFGLLFFLCGKAGRLRAPLWSLGQAGYTLYLTHHLVVAASTLGLKRLLGSGSPLAFLLVLILGLTLPYALHRFLVERFRILRLLLNGAWSPFDRNRGGRSDLGLAPSGPFASQGVSGRMG